MFDKTRTFQILLFCYDCTHSLSTLPKIIFGVYTIPVYMNTKVGQELNIEVVVRCVMCVRTDRTL